MNRKQKNFNVDTSYFSRKTWLNLGDDLVNLKCQTMTTKQEAQGALSTALCQGSLALISANLDSRFLSCFSNNKNVTRAPIHLTKRRVRWMCMRLRSGVKTSRTKGGTANIAGEMIKNHFSIDPYVGTNGDVVWLVC